MAFKILYTTTDKLPEITLAPGQLIFCQDDRSIRFVNSETELINYQSVVSLDTDAEREALLTPYPALYWVRDTKELWRYDAMDGWSKVSSGGSGGEQQIVFGTRPAVGEADKLYIDGVCMYLYLNGEYVKINGGGGSLDWLPIE